MASKFLRALLTVCLIAQTVCFAVQYDIDMVMLEDAQAFIVSETVTYTNETDQPLEDVMFSCYINCLRRQTTLPYDNQALESAFYAGYAPSGADITSVKVNGSPAEWAVQGDSECFIRVKCPLEPGQSAEISFSFTLLLSVNRGFCGWGSEDIRLMLCFPAVCALDEYGFITNPASRGGEWFWSETSSFDVTITLPEGCEPACAGTISGGGGIWHIELDSAREFALTLSRRFHTLNDGSVTVYASDRIKAAGILKTASRYVEKYAEMLGSLPSGTLAIVLSETAVSRVTPGMIVLSADDTESLPSYIARQYFMNSDPAVDPFLTAGTAEYARLLALKAIEGEKAFKNALTQEILPELSITIPGNLTPDSQLTRFTTRSEYNTIVRMRGAAVLHEICLSMGEEAFTSALAAYSEGGSGIEDFVNCLNASAGHEMGEALISWLYTIDEYALINPENYE